MLNAQLREHVLVRVPDDLGYAGQGGDFFGSTLSVASGDDDLSTWILTVNAADGGAGVVVGRGGDRAGVQHDQFSGGGGLGTDQAFLLELPFEGGAVGLGGAASEILNEIPGHFSYGTRRPAALRCTIEACAGA